MALKLPKQFHPDFSRPWVKPTGPVEVDWSNPLARGLVECYVFVGGICVNLVDNFVCTPTSGVTFKQNNAVFNNNSKITLKGPVPVYDAFTVTGRITPKTINFDGIWGDKNSTTFGQDNGAGINIRSDGALAFKVGLDDTRTAASTMTAGATKTFSCTYNLAGAENQKIFCDGAEVASYQTQQASSAYTQSSVTSRLGTYYSEGSSWSFDGTMEFLFVHSRRLSDSEIASLSRDPYQILKPAQPMMLFTGAGGGGPSTQTLLVSSIVTGEAFGQPGVSFSALSIAMSAIASGEAVGQVTIDTSRSVGLSAIPSLEAFGLYSVTTGAVTVSTLGIASGEAAGLISIASGTYVNPVGIGSSEALGQVSVQTLSVDILPVGIGSLEAFGLPDVPREAVTIAVQPANYGEVMGEPLILVGDVTVAVNSASAGESMGQPEVKLAQMFIRPEGIYSGMMFGRIAIVGGDFVYVASDYAVISPVVKSVVESVVTGLAA